MTLGEVDALKCRPPLGFVKNQKLLKLLFGSIRSDFMVLEVIKPKIKCDQIQSILD